MVPLRNVISSSYVCQLVLVLEGVMPAVAEPEQLLLTLVDEPAPNWVAVESSDQQVLYRAAILEAPPEYPQLLSLLLVLARVVKVP